MVDGSMDPEDRRKHLDFLQAVVTRMSSASTTTKGWLLPVVTATYGYSVTQGSAAVGLLGLIGVALFGIIDANYLNQERAFRELYDAVARGDEVPPFSMDPSLAAPAASTGGDTGAQKKQSHRWIPPLAVWTSWAIAPFYGVLLLVGGVILIFG